LGIGNCIPFAANGQLKESNYEGRKVNITINGWGNKIANDLMLVLIPTPMTLFGQSLWRRHQKEATTTNTL
jgi:hypothetical protein